MKKLLIAGAAALFAGPAFAADLPRSYEPAAPAPSYISPGPFTWTGFYVGAQLGGAFGSKFDNSFTGLGHASGVVVGGQAGYNYQVDQFVVGLEGDVEYTDLERKHDGIRAEQNYKASITPRIGYAIDNFLPYVKGGFAFGNTEVKNNGGGSDSNTLTGYTLGAGVEYAFTPNITAKVEYDYTDLARDRFNSVDRKVGLEMNEVKAGINYKF